MWQPKERIKYKPVPGRWPTAAQATSSKLFSPLKNGRLELEQRTWIPAMVPWRATEEGEVTPAVIDWYRRFAQGRPGAIVIEATGVRDIPSGPLLRAGHDKYIEGLAKIVSAVRQASGGHTRLFIQLIDFLTVRRRIAAELYIERYLPNVERYAQALALASDASESEIRNRLLTLDKDQLKDVLSPRDHSDLMYGFRDRVSDLNNPAIAELPKILPQQFADAALRAQHAGFDGVELHFAHAYTMASFLSHTNNRQDNYGGSLENRLRLPMEIFHAVRKTLSQDQVVGARQLSEECIDNGSELSDSAYFATQFAAQGMDFISVSRGGKFDDAKQPKVGSAVYPYTGRSGYECMPQYVSDQAGPFGRNIEPTAEIRKKIRDSGLTTPVVVAGGFHNFEQAEDALTNNKADIIGFARQSMADPDWFEKVRRGKGSEVRLCEYTNYCEGLDQKHKQVTCNLWDRTNLDEPGCAKSHDNRRRLIAPDWQPLTIKPDSGGS